jgi:hypothetical protein
MTARSLSFAAKPLVPDSVDGWAAGFQLQIDNPHGDFLTPTI